MDTGRDWIRAKNGTKKINDVIPFMTPGSCSADEHLPTILLKVQIELTIEYDSTVPVRVLYMDTLRCTIHDSALLMLKIFDHVSRFRCIINVQL